jgi:hypothetical protein
MMNMKTNTERKTAAKKRRMKKKVKYPTKVFYKK